mgnify:CR=1 FL=1
MNNVEAKFILQAYRPNGADAGDAIFCAALDQAKLDPGLGRWFAQAQAFDSAISARLSQLPAPAGLREAILAGGRATTPDTTRRSWWRQPAFAAAASFAVLVAASVAFWPKQAVAGDFTAFLLNDAKHSETHGGEGENNFALQAYFTKPETHLGGQPPLDFERQRSTGCRSIKYGGKDVLEICFQRDGVWFHCYMVRKADFPALAAAAMPVITEHGKDCMAEWADNEHVYFVISKLGREVLEKLV